jgi:hypothetical protein
MTTDTKPTVLGSDKGNGIVFGLYPWLVAELAQRPAGATVGDVCRHHAANGDKLAAWMLKNAPDVLTMTAADLNER